MIDCGAPLWSTILRMMQVCDLTQDPGASVREAAI